MRNIKSELDDSLRPEYKRSDLGRLVRGAVTQVEFAELVALLLSCIGEDGNIEFEHHSTGNYPANHKPGDWTYEIDNANQITLRYWLTDYSNISESILNSPTVITSEDRTNLQGALTRAVTDLRVRVAKHHDPDER